MNKYNFTTAFNSYFYRGLIFLSKSKSKCRDNQNIGHKKKVVAKRRKQNKNARKARRKNGKHKHGR